jgi:hypothetical protein
VGQPAVYEPIGYQSLGYRVKEALLGRPLPTSRLVYERLRKLVALAVFCSDAISSTAYGTEQIMLILVTAGSGWSPSTSPSTSSSSPWPWSTWSPTRNWS